MKRLAFGNKVNFKVLDEVDIGVANETNSKNSNWIDVLKKLDLDRKDLATKSISRNKIVIKVLGKANTRNLIIKFDNKENKYKEPDFKNYIIVSFSDRVELG